MSNRYPRGASIQKNRRSSLLLVLTAFTLGYLTALFFDFSALVRPFFAKKEEGQPSVSKPKLAEKNLVKPKLEFYTLLAKDNGNAPAGEMIRSPKTEPPSLSPNTKEFDPEKSTIPPVLAKVKAALKPDTFQVQVAAFNREQDAEEMKAALLLSGYRVKIIPISQNDRTWFRVIIGPSPPSRKRKNPASCWRRNKKFRPW